MPRMIFHVPFEVDESRQSGSQIRPRQMMAAFERIGFEVEAVQGCVRERRRKIREIKERIKEGEPFDFAYSESSTMPTALTEKHHLPVAPFLDLGFVRFLRKNGIRTGLFYRDIHWLFEQYSDSTGPLKRAVAKVFYRFDLLWYRLFVDRIYLPCHRMAKYMAFLSRRSLDELPPGAGHEDSVAISASTKKPYTQPLRLIYAGGMGKLYNLSTIVELVGQMSGVFLTICTRHEEWERNKKKYGGFTGNFDVVSHSGQALRMDYLRSDLGVLYVEPVAYWEFVMPVKLFEYMSVLLPVIGVQGTAAGSFVSENDVGWSVPYSADALRELLLRVQQDPAEIREKVRNIQRIIDDHTWEARARKVAMDLSP